MKKLFMPLLIAVVISCNNNADNSTHSDTAHADHSMPDTSSDVRSMYQLMQDNMQQMMMVKSVGNPDIDFAALMKIHHQGAVDMAELQIAQGKDEQIKRMSQQIIADQQKEIAAFDSLIAVLKSKGNDSAFFRKSMEDMHHIALSDERSNVDKEFLQMMIPHHEGAIVMAKSYLQNGAKNALLKQIANNIIKTQQQEIEDFKRLLTDLKH